MPQAFSIHSYALCCSKICDAELFYPGKLVKVCTLNLHCSAQPVNDPFAILKRHLFSVILCNYLGTEMLSVAVYHKIPSNTSFYQTQSVRGLE